MRTLHRAMIAMTLAAALAVAVGAIQPWNLTAAAQHGQAADPQAHFNAVAERLQLTAVQRETLKASFDEAFAAMQELHRLHGVIAAELTDGQKEKLAQMVHEMLGAPFAQQPHDQPHPGEGRH